MPHVVRLLAPVVLLAACADAGSPPPATTATDDSAASAAAVAAEPETPFGWMPAPEDSARPAGSIGDIDKAHQVIAVIKEWEIDVSPGTVQAGEVTIALENRGERPHTIELRGERAGRWRSLPIPPGGTVTMTMALAPDNYVVISANEAYVERGMRNLLIVR